MNGCPLVPVYVKSVPLVAQVPVNVISVPLVAQVLVNVISVPLLVQVPVIVISVPLVAQVLVNVITDVNYQPLLRRWRITSVIYQEKKAAVQHSGVYTCTNTCTPPANITLHVLLG